MDIDPKTVETHIRNIKVKLDCSTKEEIINFIERSDKQKLVHKPYTGLIINTEFEKLLGKIKGIEADISVVCPRNEKFCKKAEKHFDLCNIKVNPESERKFHCDAEKYYT